jgi:hypothetical protein
MSLGADISVGFDGEDDDEGDFDVLGEEEEEED